MLIKKPRSKSHSVILEFRKCFPDDGHALGEQAADAVRRTEATIKLSREWLAASKALRGPCCHPAEFAILAPKETR